MTDAEWLRGIADSGWFDEGRDEEVMALLRRAADAIEERDRLKAGPAAIVLTDPNTFDAFVTTEDAWKFWDERGETLPVGSRYESVVAWTWHPKEVK